MAGAILVTLAAPLASGRPPAWAPSALTLLGVGYVNNSWFDTDSIGCNGKAGNGG